MSPPGSQRKPRCPVCGAQGDELCTRPKSAGSRERVPTKHSHPQRAGCVITLNNYADVAEAIHAELDKADIPRIACAPLALTLAERVQLLCDEATRLRDEQGAP
jgi:hypothetical protein